MSLGNMGYLVIYKYFMTEIWHILSLLKSFHVSLAVFCRIDNIAELVSHTLYPLRGGPFDFFVGVVCMKDFAKNYKPNWLPSSKKINPSSKN